MCARQQAQGRSALRAPELHDRRNNEANEGEHAGARAEKVQSRIGPDGKIARKSPCEQHAPNGGAQAHEESLGWFTGLVSTSQCLLVNGKVELENQAVLGANAHALALVYETHFSKTGARYFSTNMRSLPATSGKCVSKQEHKVDRVAGAIVAPLGDHGDDPQSGCSFFIPRGEDNEFARLCCRILSSSPPSVIFRAQAVIRDLLNVGVDLDENNVNILCPRILSWLVRTTSKGANDLDSVASLVGVPTSLHDTSNCLEQAHRDLFACAEMGDILCSQLHGSE